MLRGGRAFRPRGSCRAVAARRPGGLGAVFVLIICCYVFYCFHLIVLYVYFWGPGRGLGREGRGRRGPGTTSTNPNLSVDSKFPDHYNHAAYLKGPPEYCQDGTVMHLNYNRLL